jgi:hypothetical protein
MNLCPLSLCQITSKRLFPRCKSQIQAKIWAELGTTNLAPLVDRISIANNSQ